MNRRVDNKISAQELEPLELEPLAFGEGFTTNGINKYGECLVVKYCMVCIIYYYNCWNVLTSIENLCVDDIHLPRHEIQAVQGHYFKHTIIIAKIARMCYSRL